MRNFRLLIIERIKKGLGMSPYWTVAYAFRPERVTNIFFLKSSEIPQKLLSWNFFPVLEGLIEPLAVQTDKSRPPPPDKYVWCSSHIITKRYRLFTYIQKEFPLWGIKSAGRWCRLAHDVLALKDCPINYKIVAQSLKLPPQTFMRRPLRHHTL